MELVEELRLLLDATHSEQEDFESYYVSVGQNDRPISEYMMDYFREYCGLPFKMEVKKGRYKILEEKVEK